MMIVIIERKYNCGIYLAHQHSGLDNNDITKPTTSIFSFPRIDLLKSMIHIMIVVYKKMMLYNGPNPPILTSGALYTKYSYLLI